eukprot:5514862-Alexandrium_andersonii.AAC.1
MFGSTAPHWQHPEPVSCAPTPRSHRGRPLRAVRFWRRKACKIAISPQRNKIAQPNHRQINNTDRDGQGDGEGRGDGDG